MIGRITHPTMAVSAGRCVSLGLFIALYLLTTIAASETVVTTTGSGKNYQTVVEQQQQEGNLNDEDFRQVSTLASQIVVHLNESIRKLENEQTEAAKQELNQAQALVNIIWDLLPVTIVKTTVKDKNGKDVYQYEQRAQDDLIPIYERMIAMEVVQPIVEAKLNEASVQGIRLADADVLHTSVLIDLGYIEGKINRARSLLDKPKEALAQLTLAQTTGIHFKVDKEDTPLVKAQSALRLAEKMIQEGKTEAAEDNLRLAKVHLETYRTLVGQDESGSIRQLQDQITELSRNAAVKGGIEKVHGFWDRVTQYMQKQPGEMKPVTGNKEKEAEKKS